MSDSLRPDLRERIQSMVGRLSVLSASLSAGMPAQTDTIIAAIDDSMALLASVEEPLCFEADLPRARMGPDHVAEQLDRMAASGPRPPSVCRLLELAAGNLRAGQRAEAEALEAVAPPQAPGISVVCHGPVTIHLEQPVSPTFQVPGERWRG